MIQCPSHKLSPRWVGPYKISRKISDHLYAVELPNGDTKYCNVSKLKPYSRNQYSKQPVNQQAVKTTPPVEKPAREHVIPSTEARDIDSSSSSDSDDEIECANAPRRLSQRGRSNKPAGQSTPQLANKPKRLQITTPHSVTEPLTTVTEGSRDATAERETTSVQISPSNVSSGNTLTESPQQSSDRTQALPATPVITPVQRRYNLRRPEERRQTDFYGPWVSQVKPERGVWQIMLDWARSPTG
ncbi:MAG: hypothetical protein GY774_29930 [Planctomycetes bacterium]|nr:hypothetical protein [Planctomycetota bacterium]